MNSPTPPYLKSLTEVMKKMADDGYTESFTMEDDRLKCLSCDKSYIPSEVKIINFFRDEGSSDPDDSSILYVIETVDGKKGTIMDAYGTYADPDLSGFITEVEKITKKIPTK